MEVFIMDMDEIVCQCVGVTAGDVKAAVEGGVSTVEELGEATQAGTVCGVCLDSLSELIEQFKK